MRIPVKRITLHIGKLSNHFRIKQPMLKYGLPKGSDTQPMAATRPIPGASRANKTQNKMDFLIILFGTLCIIAGISRIVENIWYKK